ncbi:MAG: U32 family peptidase [Rhodospirillaceae bacterium]|nr:U32 family peptidase [Rhodospirillaceae bacterium]
MGTADNVADGRAGLTLGPLLFHWPAETRRDFYFRIADEAAVDTVYLGEVVCSKRAPYFEAHVAEVADRLQAGGKRVVYSTLAEVMSRLDLQVAESVAGAGEVFVEANDASALWFLDGRPHAIGPFVNTYNEDTLAFLAGNNATHVTLPPELPKASVAVLGQAARDLGVTLEVQVYGRVPLALSARCYHARAHGRIKDTCRFVCEEDPDGIDLKTLDGRSFLAVNGIQTLSHPCLNLLHELDGLRGMGIAAFRLSPHSGDMVEVARLFRAVLDGAMTPQEATRRLARTGPDLPFADGFYHGAEGYSWSREPEPAL